MRGVSNWTVLELRLAGALRLKRRPVAVSFLEAPPAGVARFSGSEPSGCSFWRLASEGRVFYTVPADHFNCPIGCHTHNIPLSPEHEKEAGETLKMMFDLGYLRPEELPQIPRLAKTPAAVVYAPLGESPVVPDVMLISAKPSDAMLLNEAAQRFPRNDFRKDQAVAYSKTARALQNASDLPHALEYAQRASDLRESIAAARKTPSIGLSAEPAKFVFPGWRTT